MTRLLNKFKTAIKNYLERMAEENKKNFGNTRLDCCSINKKKKNKPKLSKSK